MRTRSDSRPVDPVIYVPRSYPDNSSVCTNMESSDYTYKLYHRAGYQCYLCMLMVFTYFMDVFSTYLCADSLSCFTGLMGVLFKWKCLKLLGIDMLKARISIQVIVTIVAHLWLIRVFTVNCTGTVTVDITLKLSLKFSLFLDININVTFLLTACMIVWDWVGIFCIWVLRLCLSPVLQVSNAMTEMPHKHIPVSKTADGHQWVLINVLTKTYMFT